MAAVTFSTEEQALTEDLRAINAEIERIYALPEIGLEEELLALDLIDAKEAVEVDLARTHAKWLLRHVKPVDEKTGEGFRFPDPELPPDDAWANATDEGGFAESWRWQLDMIDWVLENRQMIILKARQIGASWIILGIALWRMIYSPGVKIIAYRQTEKDVSETVQRVWQMFNSLPVHLRNGAEIEKPSRKAVPHTEFWINFPDGRFSKFEGKPATASAAHGHTGAMLIIDEAAHVEILGKIIAAAGPAMGKTGQIVVLSTAFGVSNPETGEGNDFHHYWINSSEYLFAKKFLSVYMHPERDEKWMENDPEPRRLKASERAAQYPTSAHEAFELTGACYFDVEKLSNYVKDKRVARPLYRFDFRVESDNPRTAKKHRHEHGRIALYREPKPDVRYAIAADSSSGVSRDYSVAYVIDLTTMEFAAEFRGKVSPERFAEQLHFLGRMFNTAEIAPEVQGGYGTTLVTLLRDGHNGRPAYPKLYRHVYEDRPGVRESVNYGYPMNKKNKPLALSQLDDGIKDGSIPYLTEVLLDEMRTFLPDNGNQSGQARPGCNDDCVIAAAIALDLYRQKGYHPRRPERKPAAPPKKRYPWNEGGSRSNEPRRYGPDAATRSDRRTGRSTLPFRHS